MFKNLSFIIIIFVFFFSCKRNPSSITIGLTPTKQYVIKDYQYAAFKYFFVDSCYRNQFEKGFDENLEVFSYSPRNLIQHLDVFISTDAFDANAIKGIASLNPSEYDSITNDEYENLPDVLGKLQKGYFRVLEDGKDYFFRGYSRYFGFFRLKEPVDNSRTLAVTYQTNSKKVGTLLSDYVESPNKRILNLKLIKCKDLTPLYKNLWDLMLKNVYEIDDSTLEIQNIKISIQYNDKGRYYTFQPNPPQKSFINLLGLDIHNNSSGEIVDNGDGKVDVNFLTNYLASGVLIFPSLQPFDPLSWSRFQLNPFNRAHIYDISPFNSSELEKKSRFKIVIEKYN